MRSSSIAILLGGLLFLASPVPSRACPLCKEAIQAEETSESGSAVDSDPLAEAQAWNNSIYLMVSMPYLLLGGVGLLIYRSVKKSQPPADPGTALS